MKNDSNYYSVIPADVRYSDLPDKAKIIYSEITALTNRFGYCFASNEYFAKLYKVHKNSISRLINQLDRAGFISIQIKYKGNTKQIEERRIFLNPKITVTPINKIDDRGINNFEKDNTTSSENSNNTLKFEFDPEFSLTEQNYIAFGDTVTMTGVEYGKLIKRYGKPDTEKMINKLDNYKASTGKQYKSDYRAILNWVADEILKTKKDSDYD